MRARDPQISEYQRQLAVLFLRLWWWSVYQNWRKNQDQELATPRVGKFQIASSKEQTSTQ